MSLLDRCHNLQNYTSIPELSNSPTKISKQRNHSISSLERHKNVNGHQIAKVLKSTDMCINHQHSPPTQAHFTAYSQLVISKPKSETLIKSAFAVDNYELPKLNRNTKPICETHEQGFTNWEEYQKHLIDKHSIKSVFQCDNCSDTFMTVSEILLP